MRTSFGPQRLTRGAGELEASYRLGPPESWKAWNIFLDWVEISSELAQDRRALGASVRDVVNSIGDTGPTRPG